MENQEIIKSKESEKGSSLVELSISILFILLLLTGTIDVGWAFFTMVSLRDAAKEGATFASICPDNLNYIHARLKGSGSGGPIDFENLSDDRIQVCIVNPDTGECNGAIEIGNDIRVSVDYDYEIMTPFMGTVLGSQVFTLTSTSSDQILRVTCPDHLAAAP